MKNVFENKFQCSKRRYKRNTIYKLLKLKKSIKLISSNIFIFVNIEK